MDRRPLLVAAGTVLVALVATGCSGGDDAPATTGPATPSAAAGPTDPAEVALTAAACGEIVRLSREELDGLADQDPERWGQFAVGLQAVANGVPDAGFREAITAMASAALNASETLQSGKPLKEARIAFEDTLLPVDSFCKRAGAPLN